MANELTITVALAFTKGNLAEVKRSKSALRFTVSGTKCVLGVQTIGIIAGGEAINLGDLGTPGWAFFFNLDPTNYITLLTSVAGVAFAKLKPGEPALLRLGCAAPAALADTAPCEIELLIIED